MGFTVSSLTDYVDQSSQELIAALHFESETAALAALHPGIKSAEAIQLLASSPVPQAATTCAFNASGDTTFSQATLTVKPVKWEDLLCMKTLEAKWTQLMLKAGTQYTESDVPRMIFDDVLAVIKEQVETADWQGDTTSTSAYLKNYDGLIKIIKAATVQTATAVAGPVTTSNVRTIVQNIISKIPAKLKGNPKFKILMGYDIASLYQQKLFIDNLFRQQENGKPTGMYAEGTVHEIIPVHGLDGFGANTGDNPFIFGCIPERNLHFGFDLLNEEEKLITGLDQYKKNVWYSIEVKRGWQIIYPLEIVEYSNS